MRQMTGTMEATDPPRVSRLEFYKRVQAGPQVKQKPANVCPACGVGSLQPSGTCWTCAYCGTSQGGCE